MTEKGLQANYAAEAEKPVDYKEAGLSEKFGMLVRRRAQLKEAIAKVEALLKGNTDDIAAELQKSGVKSVTVDGVWQATWCKGRAGSRKIDGSKLLDLGVTSDIIKRATVQGPDGKPYLLVSKVGAKTPEE